MFDMTHSRVMYATWLISVIVITSAHLIDYGKLEILEHTGRPTNRDYEIVNATSKFLSMIAIEGCCPRQSQCCDSKQKYSRFQTPRKKARTEIHHQCPFLSMIGLILLLVASWQQRQQKHRFFFWCDTVLQCVACVLQCGVQ